MAHKNLQSIREWIGSLLREPQRRETERLESKTTPPVVTHQQIHSRNLPRNRVYIVRENEQRTLWYKPSQGDPVPFNEYLLDQIAHHPDVVTCAEAYYEGLTRRRDYDHQR